MSARFGLRLRRRKRKFRGEDWSKQRAQLLEHAADLRRAPGSQAAHRDRRRFKVDPNAQPKKHRQRRNQRTRGGR